MRTLFLTTLTIALLTYAVLAGNYILSVDGKQYELDLGEREHIT